MTKLSTATLVLALMMPVMFSHPAAAQEGPPPAEEVIALADKNGDGAIDAAEWAATPAPIPYPQDADTNHDGKIDLAELKDLFAMYQSGQLPPPPGR